MMFRDELLEERDRVQAQLDALNEMLTLYPEVIIYSSKQSIPVVHKGKRVPWKCSGCGKTGHTIMTCTTYTKHPNNRNNPHFGEKEPCYVCGEDDHEMSDCPQKDNVKKLLPRSNVQHCSICGQEGHVKSFHGTAPLPENARELSKEELKAKIAAMKDAGMNSAEMAKELRVPLTKINEHWPRTTEDEDDTSGGLETL